MWNREHIIGFFLFIAKVVIGVIFINIGIRAGSIALLREEPFVSLFFLGIIIVGLLFLIALEIMGRNIIDIFGFNDNIY